MDLQNIYKKLGMNKYNGLCILSQKNKDTYKGLLSKRLEYLIKEKLRPDAFFCFDKKPLILFYDSPKNKKEIFKSVWSFNETPMSFLRCLES